MNELKPCPFCGKDPKMEVFSDGFFDFARISCCFLEFTICSDKTGEKAVAAWNTRTQN